MNHLFRYVDDKLNNKLQLMLKRMKVKHRVDKTGTIHYSAHDVDVVENDLIKRIRDSVFPKWQIISCPSDCIIQYKEYMESHKIPYKEELVASNVCFLVSRKYRPHTWKLR